MCPVQSALTLTRVIRTLHFIRVTIIEYNIINIILQRA